MSSESRRRIVSVALVLVVAIASASLVLAVGSPPNGDPPGGASAPVSAATVSTRLSDLEGLTATRTTTVERADGTTRSVERVSRMIGTGRTRVSVRSGPGEVDLRVSNGSTLWLYDREAGTATRIDRQEESRQTTATVERVTRLFARLNRGDREESGTDAEPAVSPLPVFPAVSGASTAAGPAGGAGRYTVSLDGTTTVGERRAYRIELAGPAGGEPVANYTQTLWLDATTYYPLGRQTAWTQGGERTVITTTYTNVTFDPGLGAALFEFDPPAGVEVRVPETPRQRQYDSRRALQAAANRSVPDPGLPDGFVLAEATRTSGRVTSVGLRYVNATAVLGVAKLDTVNPPTTEGESVTIAGQEAVYRNLGPEQTVVWSCGGAQYKISGRGLSRETLLDVAASVGCSTDCRNCFGSDRPTADDRSRNDLRQSVS